MNQSWRHSILTVRKWVGVLALPLLFCQCGREQKNAGPSETPSPIASSKAPNPKTATPSVVKSPPPSKPTPALLPPPVKPEIRTALLRFVLPTSNKYLFTGRDDKYFMFVDRSIDGQAVQVWQGGMYGFVRDPRMIPDGSVVFSRFHEGMDVAPARRDARGEPLDAVASMADGKVVYVNTNAGKSNYGNYVIIEHQTISGPFYSLYAHLSHVSTAAGVQVQAGGQIGIMGHTGTGIDRRRAHCHVEMNLLISSRLAVWNKPPPPPPPVQPPLLVPVSPGIRAAAPVAAPVPVDTGTLNGQNLVGLDVSGWLLAVRKDPTLRISDFIRRSEPYFKIRTPNRGGELEIVQRYPWLRSDGPATDSWEVTFAASGVPLSVAPVAGKTDFTHVAWVKYFAGNHLWTSREMLKGTGSNATLSAHGAAYVKLITSE